MKKALLFINGDSPKTIPNLSDYLFVLARYVSKLHNEPEEYWNPNDKK